MRFFIFAIIQKNCNAEGKGYETFSFGRKAKENSVWRRHCGSGCGSRIVLPVWANRNTCE
jgi:hypothetical protein